jgi:hypothetical protein
MTAAQPSGGEVRKKPMPPDLIHSLRCPACGGPVFVAGEGTTHWYACERHGPVDPIPFTSVGLTASDHRRDFSRLWEPGRAGL